MIASIVLGAAAGYFFCRWSFGWLQKPAVRRARKASRYVKRLIREAFEAVERSRKR